jgi:hypothetical protein
MSGPFDLTEKAIAEHPLPSNFVHSTQAIATWIDATAPCVKSVQSQAVTDKIVAHLRRRGANDQTIAEALKRSIYEFSPGSTPLVFVKAPLPMSNAPTMSGAPTRVDPVQQARLLDGKFEYARLNHDVEQMKVIAQMLIDLIRLRLRMRADQEKLEDVRAEILRNSPNIARVIRVVGPRAGPAPGPDGRTPRQVGPETYELVEDALLEGAEGEAEREAD